MSDDKKQGKFMESLEAHFVNPPVTESPVEEKVNGKMVVLDQDATSDEVDAYLGGPRI